MSIWQRNLLALLIAVCFSMVFYWFFVRPYAYRWKPCYGYKGYGVCLPADFDVHGIDISHHQGAIDWKQLSDSRNDELFPLRFIFLKATEGGDYADKRFTQHFDSARHYGFVRGAYHYFQPKTDPIKQADFFIRTVRLEPGDLPPVLDVEITGNKNNAELQAAVKVWLNRVEAHYGVKPILYTSYKFKKRHLNISSFSTYPYWIAHYYVDSVRYEGPWHFWQHTDVGTVPGINKSVDLNVFNGTLAQFDSLLIPVPNRP
ncbi:MAG: glycoside hydrolase family 25 protein [Mediterranea massiliensis]|nr:glycoside hydrolase family 25 protein [Mediterranea massiliensis]